MPVELSELMQLHLGQREYLTVGDLPRPIASRLGAHPAVVFLRRAEYFKLVKKKLDVTELQHLPLAIRNGRYLTDDQGRDRCVTILYQNPDNRTPYIIGLKTAARGGEVWIATYFPINEKKVQKRTARTELLFQRRPK